MKFCIRTSGFPRRCGKYRVKSLHSFESSTMEFSPRAAQIVEPFDHGLLAGEVGFEEVAEPGHEGRAPAGDAFFGT